MQTREWRSADDKSGWGAGPWQDEPDKLQWTDEATGLPCLIKRNTQVTGALCGYVGVSEGHQDFAKGYDDVPVEVHGGLTFADFCDKSDDGRDEERICHVPDPDEPDHVWWLGFDCSHSGDTCPAMNARLRSYGHPSIDRDGWETYKPLAYVKEEVTKLAAQLKERAAVGKSDE